MAMRYSAVQSFFEKIFEHCNPLWERACSRRRCVIKHQWRLTLRLREQARSHTGLCSLSPVL
ncbi:hypothetical protein FE275_26210 [Pseudomonas koreensis]|nr:hypothetical protein FE275_26210 [Pseudomonas koreensis]RBC00111.1 hypothetical protein C3E97_016895 [Pseudomonas sp. MWU12-2115]